MSNSIHLERRKINLLKNNSSFYEVIIFDDYEICNFVVSERQIKKDDIAILKYCLKLQKENDFNYQIFDTIYHSKKGLKIDGKYYEWEDIKPLFKGYK